MVDFPPMVMPARPRLEVESEAAGSAEAWVAVVDSPTLSSPELLLREQLLAETVAEAINCVHKLLMLHT